MRPSEKYRASDLSSHGSDDGHMDRERDRDRERERERDRDRDRDRDRENRDRERDRERDRDRDRERERERHVNGECTFEGDAAAVSQICSLVELGSI